ncbi:MAG: hypothetical protein KJO02_06675 [Erythrobacter sp.]|nr:hypothetical protein [Erythrobacter sp.]
MKTALALAAFALAFPAGATAQDTGEADEEETPPPPIIVTADPDEKPRRVALGSRVPRTAHFANGGIASNVGTPGLTPQSGMTPHTHKFIMRKRKGCESDDPLLSKMVVCILASGDDLAGEGDLAGAIDHYRHVAYTESYSARERHVGSEKLFVAAQDADDAGLREEGLLALLSTGELSPARAREARRSLVALALAKGDDRSAMRRLEEVVANDPEDARSLANLAAIQQRNGMPEARETIRRAIAVQEAKGYSVPKSWRQLAAGE